MEIESFYFLPEFSDMAEANESLSYWDFTSVLPEFVDFNYDHLFLPPPPAPETQVSAFVQYVRPRDGIHFTSSRSNVHRRVLEILRRIPVPKAEMEASGKGDSRCFRHMMRERHRRELQSQSYADLYAMVSLRSKADKNSIVKSSAAYLKELKEVEAKLRQRNRGLQARIAKKDTPLESVTKIKFGVGDPTSSMNSLITALQCMKQMDVKANSIQSSFSSNEVSAAIDIETKMAAGEVEKTVQSVLVKVEKQKQQQLGAPCFPQPIGWKR